MSNGVFETDQATLDKVKGERAETRKEKFESLLVKIDQDMISKLRQSSDKEKGWYDKRPSMSDKFKEIRAPLDILLEKLRFFISTGLDDRANSLTVELDEVFEKFKSAVEAISFNDLFTNYYLATATALVNLKNDLSELESRLDETKDIAA